MIRGLLVLAVGFAIGYSYGYLNGGAGEDSLVDRGLSAVGIHSAMGTLRGTSDRLARAEGGRQATLDSLRKARADSIESAIHH